MTVQAYTTAALSRARRLPRLKELLMGPPKRLSPEELAQRRVEHEALMRKLMSRG